MPRCKQKAALGNNLFLGQNPGRRAMDAPGLALVLVWGLFIAAVAEFVFGPERDG